MRATARGYELAIGEPDVAADLLIKAAPRGSFPDPELVKESARFLAPRYKEGKARWGEQDLQVWTDYPRFMIRSGRLKDANGGPITGDLDYAAFFTNDFLPYGLGR
jgi:ABC-type nitrate/sulfonate/bicarbonate transport system substrate-binding protein